MNKFMKRHRIKRQAVIVGLLLLLFAAMTGMALIGPGYSNQSEYPVATDTKHPAHKSMMFESDDERAFLFAQESLIFGHDKNDDWWYLVDGVPSIAGIQGENGNYPKNKQYYSTPDPGPTIALNSPGGGGYPGGGHPYTPTPPINIGGGPSTSGVDNPSGSASQGNGGGPGQHGDSNPDPGDTEYSPGNGKTASVPEPAPLAIMLFGLAGIGVAMLRKFRHPA